MTEADSQQVVAALLGRRGCDAIVGVALEARNLDADLIHEVLATSRVDAGRPRGRTIVPIGGDARGCLLDPAGDELGEPIGVRADQRRDPRLVRRHGVQAPVIGLEVVLVPGDDETPFASLDVLQ